MLNIDTIAYQLPIQIDLDKIQNEVNEVMSKSLQFNKLPAKIQDLEFQ